MKMMDTCCFAGQLFLAHLFSSSVGSLFCAARPLGGLARARRQLASVAQKLPGAHASATYFIFSRFNLSNEVR